jgi:hypothetical protein
VPTPTPREMLRLGLLIVLDTVFLAVLTRHVWF